MLTVKQAAKKLGVSETRVRALIAGGSLSAEKFGRTWLLPEASVEQRLHAKPQAGRPQKKSSQPLPGTLKNAQQAHHLYDQCEEILTGCYNTAFLDQARTAKEERFFIAVSDFFLQEKQRELIDQGVY
ncbi:MAG: helix-turn-helix domain-containing protein [Raoultibacter sp.]